MRTTLLVALLLLAAPLAALAPAGAESPRTLFVGPGGFASIQAAVNAARPLDVVLIGEGTYAEAVVVPPAKHNITISGESRDGVVLDGGGTRGSGITVNANDVVVRTLTAQNYRANGVIFSHVVGFTMTDLYAKNNGGYGLYAIHSTHGEISHSVGEGHGDSAFYIGETPYCDCDVHHNVGFNNMLGYSGTANSHLRIFDNEFYGNRAGILMSVLPQEMGVEDDGTFYGTQVRTEIFRNNIHDNNDFTRTTGIFETVRPPVGEGITIAGGWMNYVHNNTLTNNGLWGVGLFWLFTPTRGNVVENNVIDGSRYGVWWDEQGEDNCFEGNAISNVKVTSDPAPLPGCDGLLGDLPCPDALHDWAACRASDARAPAAHKTAWLAWRSLNDAAPDEDPEWWVWP